MWHIDWSIFSLLWAGGTQAHNQILKHITCVLLYAYCDGTRSSKNADTEDNKKMYLHHFDIMKRGWRNLLQIQVDSTPQVLTAKTTAGGLWTQLITTHICVSFHRATSSGHRDFYNHKGGSLKSKEAVLAGGRGWIQPGENYLCHIR